MRGYFEISVFEISRVDCNCNDWQRYLVAYANRENSAKPVHPGCLKTLISCANLHGLGSFSGSSTGKIYMFSLIFS